MEKYLALSPNGVWALMEKGTNMEKYKYKCLV